MADVRDLRQSWDGVCARFEQASGRQINQANTRTLEEVYQQLERKFDSKDKENGHEHDKLKTAGKEILQLLKLLGGIAGQVAGVVFGPANLCFNALSFLIDVPSKLATFAANLRALFEEIQASLLQFEIYRDIEKTTAIDPALLKVTHKVMIAFADICAVAIKFFDGGTFARVWKKTRIAILDSGSDIQSKLDEFKQLTVRQSHISDAVSLKNILAGRNENQTAFRNLFETLDVMADETLAQNKELEDTHVDVKITQVGVEATRVGVEALQKDTNERNTRSKDREDVEKICEKLLRKSKPDYPSKQFEPTIAEYQDTGSWAEQAEAYKKWANLEKGFTPILLIKGANGSGKSTLACALTARFRRLSGANESSTKVSTAFYQFPKQAKKYALQDAVRSVAAQLSDSNGVVKKRVQRSLDSNDSHLLSNPDVFDMFREIFPASGDQDESNMSFVLVFDAIDQLSDGQQRWLCQAIEKLRSAQIRFILTGNTDALDEESEGGTRIICTIQMDEQNEPDIKEFVKRSLTGHSFSEDDTPEIKQYVSKIQDQLPGVVEGSFDEVDNRMVMIIDAIENDMLENIDKILHEDASKNQHQRFVTLLERLNKDLNSKEIEQVNEILAWVIYAKNQTLSLEEGDAVLSLQNEGPLRKGLKDRITRKTGKYRRLFKISDYGDISLKNTEPEQFSQTFKNRRIFEETTDASDDPRISMTIRVHHATRPQLQQFFWDLSKQTTFNDWPVTSTPIDPDLSPVISANEVDAHLLISRRCLDLLQSTPEKETSALDEYAGDSLFYHLQTLLENVGSLQFSEKVLIVDEMISLFQSPELVKEHLGVAFLISGKWLTEEEIATMQRWFRMPEIAPRLKQRSQRWLKQTLSGDQFHPFRELAAAIAREWLCHRRLPSFYPYLWIRKYVSQTRKVRLQTVEDYPVGGSDPDTIANAGVQSAEDAWSDDMDDADKITYCANWAVDTFKIAKNSTYHHRLAGSYSWFGPAELGFENLLKAKTFPDHDWTVPSDLTDVYIGQDNTEMALQEAKDAFAKARLRKDVADEEELEFHRELIFKASAFSSMERTSDAHEWLQEALQQTSSVAIYGLTAHFETIRLFLKIGNLVEALKFIEDMSEKPAQKFEGLTELSGMMTEFSYMNYVEDLEEIFYVSRGHESSQTIMWALEEALENKENEEDLVRLYLTSGLAKVLCSPDDAGKSLHEAVDHWEKCFRPVSNGESQFAEAEALHAAGLCFTFYSREALALSIKHESEASFAGYLKKMEDLAEVLDVYGDKKPLSYPLASFHVSQGDQEKARSLLMVEFRAGLTLLSDETTDNDDEGYQKLAQVLAHTDDVLNALSALYLCFLCDCDDGDDAEQGGDTEHENELQQGDASKERDQSVQQLAAVGKDEANTNVKPSSVKLKPFVINWWCDGAACKKQIRWDEGQGIWFCTVCHNITFCDACFIKLHDGTLPRHICSPDHQCVHVSWIEEYNATEKGYVRVGGQLVDGRRVGGDFIKIDAWLDGIRNTWGVKRAEKEDEAEDDAKGDAKGDAKDDAKVDANKDSQEQAKAAVEHGLDGEINGKVNGEVHGEVVEDEVKADTTNKG